jgi:hypothetical protein
MQVVVVVVQHSKDRVQALAAMAVAVLVVLLMEQMVLHILAVVVAVDLTTPAIQEAMVDMVS